MASPSNDWQQIHNLLARYAFDIDAGIYNTMDQIFAPESKALFNLGPSPTTCNGPQEVTTFVTAMCVGTKMMHLLGAPSIIIAEDGQSATAMQYVSCTVFKDPQERPDQVYYVYAKYEDKLVKLDAGWRIKERLVGPVGPGLAGNVRFLN